MGIKKLLVMKNYCKFISLFVIFFILINIGFSQNEKSNKIETINGKKFYIHIVQKGQTLYGLSKMYDISIDEIIQNNPNTKKGLKKNENIIIPIIKNIIVENKTNETNFIYHTVVNGETLFSISQKYNLSIKELKKYNKIEDDIISTGQILNIPTDSYFMNKNISKNEIIKIDSIEKKVNYKKEKKDSFNIVLLIPFYINKYSKENIEKINSINELNDIKQFTFIQFYEGFLLGLNNYKSNGTKINLKVFDCPEDTTKIEKLLNSANFKNVDLIVGPFFVKSFKYVSKWALKNETYIINPFSSREDITENNYYAIRLCSSLKNEFNHFFKYIKSNYNECNIMLIHNNSNFEKNNIEIIKKEFDTIFKENNISLSEVVYKTGGMNEINNKLSKKNENILICLFSGEPIVTNFIRKLYELKKNNITLVGNSNWYDYDNIETEYFQALKLHYIDNFFIDYESEFTKKFIAGFREEYKTEPTMSKFAFQGYDIANYFIGAIINYGNKWDENINNYKPILLSYNLNFYRNNNFSGLININTHIYKLEDYKFSKINY